VLYGTTELFLDRLGLSTIALLPPIENFLPAVAVANEIADEMVATVSESNE
jgi:chromosome segregation and condensation protein ScpB